MTTPVDPREALARVVGRVLFHNTNYPDAVAPHVLGRDMTPLNDAITDALMAASYRPAHEVAAAKAEAWDEGHRAYQRRDSNDGCMCGAYNAGECACGLYGTGDLLSLNDNPYRAAPSVTETPEEPTPCECGSGISRGECHPALVVSAVRPVTETPEESTNG